MKRNLLLAATSFTMLGANPPSAQADTDNFYKSNMINRERVSFPNQHKVKMADNLFLPKEMRADEKRPAIIVGYPIGAVEEQSANLCVTKVAERGFVTLSIDLSFWGSSEGEPRSAVLPELYAEAFSAAVDYLRTCSFVEREHIGVIGICGSGSSAISAAKIDPRLKVIAAIGMYNMGTASRNGLRHALTLEQRKQIMVEATEQCYVEFLGEETRYTGGTPHGITENSDPIAREFYEFYRISWGEYTPKGAIPLTITHPTLSSNIEFMNFYPFADIETISPRPTPFVTGENVHPCEFSEDAYRLVAEPKELYIMPGAGHVDLYDRVNFIPFDKLENFFKTHLK